MVSGLEGILWDVDVQIFVTHEFPLDLDIALVSPNGAVIILVSDRGHVDTEVFNGVIFDDQADPGGQVPYDDNPNLASDRDYGFTPAPERLVPEEPLQGLILLGDGNGPWTLVVSDDKITDEGTILGWALDITTIPQITFDFIAVGSPPMFENNTAQVIPTGPAVIQSTIAVVDPGGIGAVGDHLCLLLLELDVTHTRNSNLDITLQSPAGTVCTITTDNGGSNDDVFAGTEFSPFPNIVDGLPPYDFNDGLITDHQFMNLVVATELTPEESFGVFTGEDPVGVWTLTISDDQAVDGGMLNSWKLTALRCSQSDADDDGVADTCDNCVDDPNADQNDADGDGIGDACDDCFGDNASGDDDADGVCNDADACADVDDALDADGDGVPDACDNAPNNANADQADEDLDGVGDVIDVCAGNDNSGDSDGDGICNNIDFCDGNNDSGDDDADGICNDKDDPAAQVGDMGACCGGGTPMMMPFLLLGWRRRRRTTKRRRIE